MISLLIENQKPRIERKLKSINDTWSDMLCMLDWIQFEHQLPLPIDTLGRQSIIRGETDGTMGMERVKQLLNWNSNATLILSGGVYGREKTIGDIGAIDLYKHIEYDLSLYGYNDEEIKSRVIIDSFSRHTIDQGKVLAGILNAINCREIFIVIPLYHMPRFLLVLSKQLQTLDCKPNIIPQPYGEWNTNHPRKGPIEKPDINYTYEELFGLPPVESRFDGKQSCGEVEKIAECFENGLALSFQQFKKWFSL